MSGFKSVLKNPHGFPHEVATHMMGM